jgi:hypothetical protein
MTNFSLLQLGEIHDNAVRRGCRQGPTDRGGGSDALIVEDCWAEAVPEGAPQLALEEASAPPAKEENPGVCTWYFLTFA